MHTHVSKSKTPVICEQIRKQDAYMKANHSRSQVPIEDSMGAKMARLRRMCERKPNGKIHCPEFIHELWCDINKRQDLLKTLEECQWDKEPKPIYLFSWHLICLIQSVFFGKTQTGFLARDWRRLSSRKGSASGSRRKRTSSRLKWDTTVRLIWRQCSNGRSRGPRLATNKHQFHKF